MTDQERELEEDDSEDEDDDLAAFAMAAAGRDSLVEQAADGDVEATMPGEPADAGSGWESEADAAEPPAVEGQWQPTPEPRREVGEIARDIEAILFISPEPVPWPALAEATQSGEAELTAALEAVGKKFGDSTGGIVFTEVADGFTFRAGDHSREAVERFCRQPHDFHLSPAAMETLAIVAYLQPVTRPEIARIRGVGSDAVVGTLLDKGLLAEAGRSQQSGAIKYRTTPAFEKLFGLPSLGSLPALAVFEASTQDVEELREKLHLAAERRQ